MHADHAAPGHHPAGTPTSSATLPGLAVQMLRHAMIAEGMDVLDVGTGSGYGCALLTSRLGPGHVTSVDVDPYLTKAAGERLDSIGLHPRLVTCDATGPLPGSYDRIVSTVAARAVPASWLAALRPGGRLVTTIAVTCLIVTADKTPDAGAAGVTQWDRAGFMTARTGPEYPPGLTARLAEIRHGIPIEQAYADDAVLKKTNSHGVTVSSVSAPGIVAMILDQLQVQPGHRILEIGSGGYNAALLRDLVGPGRVSDHDRHRPGHRRARPRVPC